MPDFTVATRASALARAQTGWVRDRLADLLGIEVAELLVTSEGDVSDAALTSFGGQGVFVARVREAVLDGRADVAVHSMKDLPTLPHPGTAIAAVPTREDVRDFLVTTRGGLDDLPSGASVGTGSPPSSGPAGRRHPGQRGYAGRSGQGRRSRCRRGGHRWLDPTRAHTPRGAVGRRRHAAGGGTGCLGCGDARR